MTKTEMFWGVKCIRTPDSVAHLASIHRNQATGAETTLTKRAVQIADSLKEAGPTGISTSKICDLESVRDSLRAAGVSIRTDDVGSRYFSSGSLSEPVGYLQPADYKPEDRSQIVWDTSKHAGIRAEQDRAANPELWAARQARDPWRRG